MQPPRAALALQSTICCLCSRHESAAASLMLLSVAIKTMQLTFATVESIAAMELLWQAGAHHEQSITCLQSIGPDQSLTGHQFPLTVLVWAHRWNCSKLVAHQAGFGCHKNC